MPVRFLDEDPKDQPRQVGVAEDVFRSAAAGAGRGLASVPGMLGDFIAAGNEASAGLAGLLGHPERAQQIREDNAAQTKPPTTQDLIKAAAPYLPAIEYQPESHIAKDVRTGAEFATGAALTGPMRGVVKRAIGLGAIPGVASEEAGQALEGSELDPWARGAAAIGAGMVGARLTAPRMAGEALARSTRNMTPEQMQLGEELFQQGNEAGRGMISRPEAYHQASGGATSLPDLQRIVEGGSDELKGFFAQRPEAVRQAGQEAFDQLAPAPAHPSMIGPDVQESAERYLNMTRRGVNEVTQPLYDQAGTAMLTPDQLATLADDPIYRNTVEGLRNNETLTRRIDPLDPRSVAMQNYVQRDLGRRIENRNPLDPAGALSNDERAELVRTQQSVRSTANEASGGTFGQAVALNAQLRQRYLEPLQRGPLGKLAEKNVQTQQAIDTLFPMGRVVQPSAEEVQQAISGVVNSGHPAGPMAARQLVRAHLESKFDDLTGGMANERGGAAFAKAVRGNEKRGINLREAVMSLPEIEGAVRGLPHGDEVWPGIDRFLTFLEAQQHRQGIGSRTAFNTIDVERLQKGGYGDEAIKTLTGSPLAIPQRIRDNIERYRLGENNAELARLFTDPRYGDRFQALARSPYGSDAFMRQFMSIAGIGVRTSGDNDPDERGRQPKIRFLEDN